MIALTFEINMLWMLLLLADKTTHKHTDYYSLG